MSLLDQQHDAVAFRNALMALVAPHPGGVRYSELERDLAGAGWACDRLGLWGQVGILAGVGLLTVEYRPASEPTRENRWIVPRPSPNRTSSTSPTASSPSAGSNSG